MNKLKHKNNGPRPIDIKVFYYLNIKFYNRHIKGMHFIFKYKMYFIRQKNQERSDNV